MIMNNEKLLNIVDRFQTEGSIESIKPLGQGFINDTYFVTLKGETQPKYILQTKNHKVFPDVPSMMVNIDKVTRHIKTKVSDPLRETLTVVPTKDGELYYKDSEGTFWAMCLFIRDSMSYDRADTPALCYQGGLGLGEFHRLVSDFNEPLTEIIKGFHNMRFRFAQWDESLKADKAGRVRSLGREIDYVESRREKISAFYSLIEDGTIPRRVSHNDTKISNFLFDRPSGKLLCAIDLDTLMSSTILNDTGDAYRTYTNTGAEDDPDLGKVGMSMEMFSAYTEGYLSKMKDCLAPSEKEYLAFSGIFLTYEQTLRFLMDYIDGDSYYKIAYPEHNLVRTRAQNALLESMEKQYDAMRLLVEKLCK